MSEPNGYQPLIDVINHGRTMRDWDDKDIRDTRDIVVLLQEILISLERSRRG